MMRQPPRDYTDREVILWEGRERLQMCVAAMQRKHDVWWRCWGLFWRKPWRSSHGPSVLSPWHAPDRRGVLFTASVSLANLWGWLRGAHDCSDPAVGCSCSGGFRYGR